MTKLKQTATNWVDNFTPEEFFPAELIGWNFTTDGKLQLTFKRDDGKELITFIDTETFKNIAEFKALISVGA